MKLIIIIINKTNISFSHIFLKDSSYGILYYRINQIE
jgi:hypothetical protein